MTSDPVHHQVVLLWERFVGCAGSPEGKTSLSEFFEAALQEPGFREELLPLLGEECVATARAKISNASDDHQRTMAEGCFAGLSFKYLAVHAAGLRFGASASATLWIHRNWLPRSAARALLLAGRDAICTLYTPVDVIVDNAALLPAMGALQAVVQTGVHTGRETTILCAALADHPPPALVRFRGYRVIVDTQEELADPPRMPADLRDVQLSRAHHLLPWFTRAWQRTPPVLLETLDLDLYQTDPSHSEVQRLLADVHFPRLATLTLTNAVLPLDIFQLLCTAAPRLDSLNLSFCLVAPRTAAFGLPLSLRSLTLDSVSPAPQDGAGANEPMCSIIDSLHRSSRSLETLHVGFAKHTPYLQNDAIVLALQGWVATAPPLKNLRLYGSHLLYPDSTMTFIRTLANVAPTLTSLCLTNLLSSKVEEGPTTYAQRLGEAIVAHCPGLVSLSFDGPHIAKDDLYAALVGSLCGHRALATLHLDRYRANVTEYEYGFPLTKAAFARINLHRRQEARWRLSWAVVVRGILSAQERRVQRHRRTPEPEGGVPVRLAALLPPRVLREIDAFLPGPFVELSGDRF
jgi:hypothetical protein